MLSMKHFSTDHSIIPDSSALIQGLKLHFHYRFMNGGLSMVVFKTYGQMKSKNHSNFISNLPQIIHISQNPIPQEICYSMDFLLVLQYYAYYPPLASFSLVREYKIKWWEKFAVNKFCSLHVVQAKLLYTTQQVIPVTPSTPQKKQEQSSKDKGKATLSNEIDELQLLRKEIKLLKK